MCIINRVKTNQCCGCSACVSVCPKECLTLNADKNGFLQVKLSKHNCIECGLCSFTCPSKIEVRDISIKEVVGRNYKFSTQSIIEIIHKQREEISKKYQIKLGYRILIKSVPLTLLRLLGKSDYYKYDKHKKKEERQISAHP